MTGIENDHMKLLTTQWSAGHFKKCCKYFSLVNEEMILILPGSIYITLFLLLFTFADLLADQNTNLMSKVEKLLQAKENIKANLIIFRIPTTDH